MSTRHIIQVQIGNEIKVSEYVHSDGYPTYTGNKLIEFISKMVNGSDIEEEAIRDQLRFSLQNSTLTKGNFHNYSGSVHDLLEKLTKQPDVSFEDHTSFAGNSLFCEWGYRLVFDSGYRFLGMEVYNGFNKTKPSPFWMHEEEGSEYKGISIEWVITRSDFENNGMIQFQDTKTGYKLVKK